MRSLFYQFLRIRPEQATLSALYSFGSMMKRWLGLCVFLGIFLPDALAGERLSGQFVGQRYAPITVNFSPEAWAVESRENEGENTYGGPVADLRALKPVAESFPMVFISAFVRADAMVTPDFVLRTSVQGMRQRGANPGPVLVRTVNEKKIWFFEADVEKDGRALKLYYVLLAGEKALFAVQTVVPPQALEATEKAVDQLLLGMTY